MTPPLQTLAETVDVGIKNTARVRCRHREGDHATRLGSHVPTTLHPALWPPALQPLTEMTQVLSISTIFNLPSAPWPHFYGSSLTMAASGSHDSCYENIRITKHLLTVFWSSPPAPRHPPVIKWITRTYLGADIDVFPAKKIYKKLTSSALDFFKFNFIFLLDFFPPSERNLPYINLDVGYLI